MYFISGTFTFALKSLQAVETMLLVTGATHATAGRASSYLGVMADSWPRCYSHILDTSDCNHQLVLTASLNQRLPV